MLPYLVNLLDDWALLTLTRPITNAGTLVVAPLSRDELPALRADGLTQAAYHQDKAHILSLHQHCPLIGLAAGSGAILHRCDATRGSSGSAILRQSGDGYAIIGIHVATVRTSTDSMGAAVPVPESVLREVGGEAALPVAR